MHGEIRRNRDGEQKGDAGAPTGLGHGREDEEVGQGGGRAGHAGGKGKRVEQEAVHGQYAGDMGTAPMCGLPCYEGSAAPPQAQARRLEQARSSSMARVCNLSQGMGAQQVDHGEEQIRRERRGRGIGEEREEREEQRCLVEHATVVGRDIVGVEVEALLDCMGWSVGRPRRHRRGRVWLVDIRLLKLDTGVDSSTRPARRSGSNGKAWNRSRRTAAAAAKRAARLLAAKAMVVAGRAATGWLWLWLWRGRIAVDVQSHCSPAPQSLAAPPQSLPRRAGARQNLSAAGWLRNFFHRLDLWAVRPPRKTRHHG